MQAIDAWFTREVLQWRSGAAIVWSTLSLLPVTVVYQLATNLNIFHPLQWITESVMCVISAPFLMTLFLIMIVNGAYFMYQKSTFTVIPKVNVTKFSQLPQLCTPAVMFHTGVCTCMGFVLGWICTCLLRGRYANLAILCEQGSEVECINEYHLFLVMYGGYTGFTYIIYHYIRHNCVLHFPYIHQAKYFQVRHNLMGTLWSSVGHTIWQIKFYYIFYYLLGHIPRDWIVSMCALSLNTGKSRLDTVYGLIFDVGLLWQTLLVGVFIHFTWNLAALLYKIYVTESYEFPISSMFDNFKNKCLVDALSCTSSPLLQALGFLDLYLLSKHSSIRRKELFSLSQPGGHPHNWNKVMSVCVAILTELNDSVQEANWHILANAPVRQTNNHDRQPSTVGSSSSTDSMRESTVADTQQSVRERIVSGIRKRPIVKFFSGDSPEWKNSKLFSSAYIQISAVEALAALVSASYREDPYGVVQMSLPDIITAVLNLQENVDKHFKLTGGVSRRIQKDVTSLCSDATLKYELHAALRRSIYSIVNTFGKHLLDVALPGDTEKKLRQFLEYRE